MQCLHLALGLQGGSLCGDYVQVTHRAGFIAVGGDCPGVFGGVGCGLFIEALLLQVSQLGEVVFNFTHRVQHLATVMG